MKKSLISILVFALVLSLSMVVFAATYSDISGHWAESSIERWSKEKIVEGYNDGTFRPDEYITRSEFVTIIMRIFEPEKAADIKSYKDISKDAWYYDALARAVGMKALQGDPDITMRPEAYITRQEAVVILNRIIGLKASKNASLDKFSDKKEVASWAEAAMLAFEERGFIIGYEDGTVRPTRNITRAETVKLLDKVVSAIITKAGTYDLDKENGIVVVKAKNVTLENTDDVARIFALNNGVRDTLKPELKDEDIINPEEKKPEEERTSGGGGGSTTRTTNYTITLTANKDIYDITTSGDLSKKMKVTVIVKNGNEEATFGPELLSKSTFTSAFKARMLDILKAALNDGVVTAEMLTKTANDTYAPKAEVVALGKQFRDKITGDAEKALTAKMIADWKAGTSMEDIYAGLTKADKATLASILLQADYDTVYGALEIFDAN